MLGVVKSIFRTAFSRSLDAAGGGRLSKARTVRNLNSDILTAATTIQHRAAYFEVSAHLRDAWRRQSSGSDFARMIQAQGLTLARGRRGIVVVDAQGVLHSLPRRLGLRAAEVHAGLQSIDIDRLPTVADAKRRGVAAPSKEKSMGNKRKGINGVACAKDTSGRQRPSWPELQDYWTQLGFTSDLRDEGVWVNLNDGGWLHDAGDRITVYRDGDPTDDDIRLLVQTGRERGWQTIRFFGGSDEWQRRACEEAIRQGFPPHAISLECEDAKASALSGAIQPPAPLKPPPSDEPMPEHLMRRLGRMPIGSPSTPRTSPEPANTLTL